MSAPPRLDATVRAYAAADRAAVRALLHKTFTTASIFDRFADGNPLGDFVAVVAEHEGAVVGFNMWNPWLVHTATGAVTAYQSGASAVDDSMRGQGIFGKLLRTGEALAKARGIAMLFGFPNPASLPAFLKAGWEHPCSLRLYVASVASVGLGPLLAPLAPPVSSANSAAARFVAWRYAGADARVASLRGGRRVTVYTRTERRAGATLNKLLDIVDDQGARVTDHLGLAALRLPGPGATIMRATRRPAGVPPWIGVRRRWETPLILKRLLPGGCSDDAMRGATYWYGDIDAS